MGEEFTLVSSAEETAKDVYARLVQDDLLRAPAAPAPEHRFLTTGRPDEFGVLGRRFLGPEVGAVGQFAQVVA
jgi:glutamate racemase